MSVQRPTFDAHAERLWLDSIDGPRDHLRQVVVGRQLAEHLPPRRLRVLDVGCGQGTQVIELARRGHTTAGVDSSPRMLTVCRRMLKLEPKQLRQRVSLHNLDGQQVPETFEPGSFDVALCHGVLAYSATPVELLRAMRRVVHPEGIVSLLTVSEEYAAHQADQGLSAPLARDDEGRAIIDRGGVPTVAFSRPGLQELLAASALEEVDWYGIRGWSETQPDHVLTKDSLRASFLDEAYGKHDPHRAQAPFVHTICQPQEAAVA